MENRTGSKPRTSNNIAAPVPSPRPTPTDPTPRPSLTPASRMMQLRQSIGRRALSAMGVSADARILDVRRIRSVFIVVTEELGNRWAPFGVDTFRIPTADNTDPGYYDGEAPKVWGPLAGWACDDAADVAGILAKAEAYANDVTGVAAEMALAVAA